MVVSNSNDLDGPNNCKAKCNRGSKAEHETSTTIRNQARKVSFRSRVNCRRFYTSADEKEDRWYSPDEMRSHKHRDRHLQALLGVGAASLWGNDNPDSLLLFGLKSDNENKSRKQRIRAEQESVVHEQYSQEKHYLTMEKDENLDVSFRLNQEAIAKRYTKHSRKASLLAYVRGMQTSQHVQEFSNDKCGRTVSPRPSKLHCASSRSDKLRDSPRPGKKSNRCLLPAYRMPTRRRLDIQ